MSDISNVISRPSEATQDRRGLRWIDPGFQRRYAWLLLSVVLLVSTVLVGTFWFHSEQVLNTLSNAGVIKDHRLFQLIEKQMHSLIWSVVLVTALFSGFVFMMATFLSHRIVGPIFAIKRSLECIGRGQYEDARLKLRTDDEFQDVAELVNSTVDRISKS